jgi:hypothetical protein
VLHAKEWAAGILDLFNKVFEVIRLFEIRMCSAANSPDLIQMNRSSTDNDDGYGPQMLLSPYLVENPPAVRPGQTKSSTVNFGVLARW